MRLTRRDLLNSSSLTPIGTLGSEEQSESPKEIAFAVEYTQIAFPFVGEKMASRLKEALGPKPRAIRSEYLLAKLPPNTELDAEIVWPVARALLDVLEAEIESVLKRRSVFFWLHIYRRIGVMLSPSHEDKTDERTVALVRQIVELAIAKHGKAGDGQEFARSDTIAPDEILGGYYRQAVTSAASESVEQISRLLEKSFKERPTFLIRDFGEDDFVGIYYVEGLAYQYWRVTALMRTLGKGGRLKIEADGDWVWVGPDDLEFLTHSIDERTNNSPFQFSFVGVWFDETKGDQRAARRNALVCPIYNTERVSIAEFLNALGISAANDAITNFLPGLLDLQAYVKAHQFLSEAFNKFYGFTLEALASTLWATGSMLLLPDDVLFDEDDRKQKQLYANNLLTLLQRGYKTLRLRSELEFAEELVRRMKLMKWPLEVPIEEVQAVIKSLTLTPEGQEKVGLWSGGPRFLYLPAAFDHAAVDLQGIPAILATLFFRVAHDQTARGTVFEEAFRNALNSRGYTVHNGDMVAPDGSSRELDAGIWIGDTLFVFECVSVERPLDYEIGKPGTFAVRQERLDDKVTQAISLVDFFEAHPKGRNYNFSDVKRFEPFVVSPFVEWIWNRSARLWFNEATPRILSAWEAIKLLESYGND